MPETKTHIVNSDSAYKEFESETLEDYKNHKYLVISVRFGRDRTLEQNKLQRKWLKEAEEQGDQTAEEYRGYCKLHFGIPIRREEDSFGALYDKIIKPLDYEDKLKAMMLPFDLPVTRDMTRAQKVKYLDKMYEHFTGLGFKLTEPKKR